MSNIQIKFCGAAGVVTGSSYLVSVPQGKFLVDCGLFQGTKTVRELNYGDFGFNAEEISFVLLTHAHIDHSGLLPKLYSRGFTGAIYATEATKNLLEYMLPDSANIQETEVRRLNEKNRQRGLASVEPIYTQEDVSVCLENMRPVRINGWIDLPLGVSARYWNAGHILGSASIELKLPDGQGGVTHVLFSGDLGPDNKTFHANPESPKNIDYVVVESTYGDRERIDYSLKTRRETLKTELLAALEARGNILIPSFAVERTQEILLDIDWLVEHSELPEIPLFIDSPLATKVTRVFDKYRHELEDMSGYHDDTPFKGKNIRYVEDVEESKRLNRIRSGAIIMAGSGMCEAGRIRHHLKNNLWNSKSTVLFVGYQAEGTLGKMIQSGAKRVRIHGREIDVNARIRTIDTYSAHADQSELVQWVTDRLPVHKNVFLTHGRDEARTAFKEKLMERGLAPDMLCLPVIDDVFSLDSVKAEKIVSAKPRVAPEELQAAEDWHNSYARFVLDLAQFLREMDDSAARRTLLDDLMNHISNKRLAPFCAVKKHNGKK